MAEFVCAYCGKRFSAKPSKHPKYCSQACYRAIRSLHLPQCEHPHDIRDHVWLEARVREGMPVEKIAYLAGCSATYVYRVAHREHIRFSTRKSGLRAPVLRVSPALAEKLGLASGG